MSVDCWEKSMISHSHKVIFIHVPKCAGQSIEMIFLKDLGLTWEFRAPLLLRPKSREELGPERLAHLFANEYVKFGYIEASKFNDYFKFAIIRDPIDRILSELNYRQVKRRSSVSTTGVTSVEEYIMCMVKKHDKFSDCVRHIEPQVNFIYNEDQSQIIVNKIIDFSFINIIIDFISTNHLKNPHVKIERRNISESKIWTKHDLSNEDKKFLSDYYKEDFRLLDYVRSQPT